MAKIYIEDKTFAGEDFGDPVMEAGEYDNCIFSDVNLSNASFADFNFIDCTFNNCDLSMAVLTKTAFRDVTFTNCKLLGLRFDDCDAFLLSVSFDNCILDFASFFKLKLKKTKFINCQVQQADFSEADLAESVFDQCNLSGSTFDNTNLEKADLRTAFNYRIDPEKNRIKKAKFSQHGLQGLLGKYDIDIT